MATTTRPRNNRRTAPKSVEVPETVAAYLARLVNPEKLTYARSVAAAIGTGNPAPTLDGKEWAPKVVAKLTKLYAKAARQAAAAAAAK